MKARQNSQLRLLPLTMLPTIPLLNKLPLPKVGNPLEVARNGALKLVIPSGVLEVEVLAILNGVLKQVITTGPPLPLPPPRMRMPKSLPSGPTAVPGTVKRMSQITR